MSDKKNENIGNIDNNSQPVEDTGKTATPDPFAPLNKLLAENPALKTTFDSINRYYEEDDADSSSDSDEMGEMEYVEINGHDYLIAREMEISGTTYLYLVNEDDVMDFMIQKIVVEDGEEYVVGLDSDKEFDLVQLYFQRQFLLELKEKMKKDGEETPDKPDKPDKPE